MGRVSRDARLLFILLWTVVDDEGRTRGASRMLASLLYPYDDDAPKKIDGWLAELEAERCVVRYQVGGATYLAICNLLTHQKIDKATKSKLPPFDDDAREFARPREDSRDLHDGSGSGSGSGSGREGIKDARERARATDGLDLESFERWDAYRREIKKPLKASSLIAAAEELAKFDSDQAAVVQQSIANGWQGLFPLKTQAGRAADGKRELEKWINAG